MELKNYLIETFEYNDYANMLVLKKIKELPDKTECIKFFSHLINCQYKWLDRILLYPGISQLDWWLPLYKEEELESQWSKSLQNWISFLQDKTEGELLEEVRWIGINNEPYTAQLKDIPLQLNYHSIHHRAQMQMIIRQQGLVTDFVDYISTRYRKI